MSTSSVDNSSLIGFKEFRENSDKYLKEIAKGRSFTVLRRSKPVFRIGPVEDDWSYGFVDDDHPRGVPVNEFITAAEKVLKTKAR